MPSRLEGVWYRLWESPIRDHTELETLAVSYLEHLGEHSGDLSNLLSDLNLAQDLDIQSVLDYVSWITLGVGLVDGFRWGSKLTPSQRSEVRSAVKEIVSTRQWGPNTLRPLKRSLVPKPRDLRESEGERQFLPAIGQLRLLIADRAHESDLAEAYLLGVLNQKDLWENCTESVQSIFVHGEDDFYHKKLAAELGGVPSVDLDLLDIVERWRLDERQLRSNFHWGRPHGL